MKIKFTDGTVKECTAPTEQKVFKTLNGETVGVGWILMIRLIGKITADELDKILTTPNVASLEFYTESEDGEKNNSFVLEGYDKISSSVIRHAENADATHTEIQLTKGL